MIQDAILPEAAGNLDPPERTLLAASLLKDLDPCPHWVADEDAISRLDELTSGRVEVLSEADFWKACGRS